MNTFTPIKRTMATKPPTNAPLMSRVQVDFHRFLDVSGHVRQFSAGSGQERPRINSRTALWKGVAQDGCQGERGEGSGAVRHKPNGSLFNGGL